MFLQKRGLQAPAALLPTAACKKSLLKYSIWIQNDQHLKNTFIFFQKRGLQAPAAFLPTTRAKNRPRNLENSSDLKKSSSPGAALPRAAPALRISSIRINKVWRRFVDVRFTLSSEDLGRGRDTPTPPPAT